jgi:hypothetical protein
MGNITMPEVEQATHLGIIRTTTMKHNIQTNVDENITKARRSAGSGQLIGNDRICFSILFWKSSSCSRGFEDVIIAPYRKAILVLCRFCRCVVGIRDPGRCE